MKATTSTPRTAVRASTILCCGLLFLGSGGALSAQTPTAPVATAAPLRSGFHFSIGAGAASVGATCTVCEVDFFADRINGFSGNLQLGGALNEQLVVAVEFMGWMRNDDPIYRRMAALNLVFLGYPSARSGFFIKGGGGVVRAIVEDDFLTVQTDAYTAESGIGYDMPVGDRAKLTLYANYVRTFAGGTWFNGILSPVVISPNAIQVGTALTIH